MKTVKILMASLFLVSLPALAFAQSPQDQKKEKTECTQKKECTKDKSKCTKDKKECIKQTKENCDNKTKSCPKKK
ncbi:MAG: hypothetical protein ACRDD6_01295 [Tannerellaceae bacterium]